MARRYSEEELEKMFKIIRTYNGRVTSYEDWYLLLSVTEKEFNEIVEKMPEHDNIVRNTNCNYSAKFRHLYYQPNEKLGKIVTKSGITMYQYISSLETNLLLSNGPFKPSKYDIIYAIVEDEEGYSFRKYVVEKVRPDEKGNMVVSVRMIKSLSGRTLKQLAADNEMEGIERYLLSILH